MREFLKSGLRGWFRGYGGWPTYNYRPLYLQAFDFFVKNLGMIIPAIIALIISLIVGFVVGAIGAALALTGLSIGIVDAIGFVIGFISGIIISFLILIEAYEAGSVVNGNLPDIGLAWQSTQNTREKFLPTALLTGLIFGVLSALRIPGSFLIEGLFLVLVYVVSSGIVSGVRPGLEQSLNWYSSTFSKDGVSSLILLLGAILSLVPILNLFVIPYTELLATLMVRKY
ncbi:hypothetical protein HA72_0433 [Metallosphaera sedula]|uniref:Uncharacterized protein n=3 Tax=Metallosphaera TaxID=41980 RepID=A4YDV8_METS5|nr:MULTISPECIES: hypothetical protein [Metallosphaera]ABP94610.1 hypothetical protein Msed_0433 [Metallosphaera sedula DSM 5348]AIM26597.1 hypothetical protein HA72_0433 [Metallosphaera sedula]AKV73578.1 hypothetical protein MsedA_0446 [Metallosphaera sedula]AKV75819.1 hypothetical protein MsedB_0446 [Metallosphaera sedula]AKV78068.1 hypothetical protein MsedC_0445 [Metallosphaera sedula]